jgi:hypothetical protein
MMSRTIAFPINRHNSSAQTLPRRRVFWVDEFAAIFGKPLTWVYARTTKRCKDPIPRCPGSRELAFNPADPKLQEWVTKHFGPIDLIAALNEMLDASDGGNLHSRQPKKQNASNHRKEKSVGS